MVDSKVMACCYLSRDLTIAIEDYDAISLSQSVKLYSMYNSVKESNCMVLMFNLKSISINRGPLSTVSL